MTSAKGSSIECGFNSTGKPQMEARQRKYYFNETKCRIIWQ